MGSCSRIGGTSPSPACFWGEFGGGLQRHRSVLFKYVCDALHICPCALLWDARRDSAEVVAWVSGRPMTLDLMEDPGELRDASDLHSLVQQLESKSAHQVDTRSPVSAASQDALVTYTP